MPLVEFSEARLQNLEVPANFHALDISFVFRTNAFRSTISSSRTLSADRSGTRLKQRETRLRHFGHLISTLRCISSMAFARVFWPFIERGSAIAI